MYCTTDPTQTAAELETARRVIAKLSPITNRTMAQADALDAAWATLRVYGPTITANEVAKRLGVTRQATSVWAQQGRIPGARKDAWSGYWRIPEEAVEIMRIEREAGHSENSENSEKSDGAAS